MRKVKSLHDTLYSCSNFSWIRVTPIHNLYQQIQNHTAIVQYFSSALNLYSALCDHHLIIEHASTRCHFELAITPKLQKYKFLYPLVINTWNQVDAILTINMVYNRIGTGLSPGANLMELLKQTKLLKHENSSLILHMLVAIISCFIHIYIACDWYLAVVELAQQLSGVLAVIWFY